MLRPLLRRRHDLLRALLQSHHGLLQPLLLRRRQVLLRLLLRSQCIHLRPLPRCRHALLRPLLQSHHGLLTGWQRAAAARCCVLPPSAAGQLQPSACSAGTYFACCLVHRQKQRLPHQADRWHQTG